MLINLLGGGFVMGGRWGGRIESIPIAAVSRTKVVSVDYQMAPEHRFRAATEDVVSAYRALLGDCNPAGIGIYGSSAGALLSAQAVVRLQQTGLPLPAAIGIFFFGGKLLRIG